MKDFSDKIYNAARRRGYLALAGICPDEFELSFVGCWIIKYKNDLKVLSMLSDITNKPIVEWSDLTERTLKQFKNAVLSSMCANSAKTTFAKLKSILNDMKGEVQLPCLRYEDILKCKAEPSQAVYLTELEISKLENVEVNNKEEQYVKCLYLLECYCGARHSDIKKLTNNNIKSVVDENGNIVKRYISYVSQKTKTETYIPLHRNFISCLNGYDKNIDMLDYVFNDILRDLCKRAGIVEEVQLFRRGSYEKGPKYQFIASHNGRKSFCSNLYLRGVDSRTISKLAGHSNSVITETTYIVPIRDISENAMSFFN